MKVTNKQLAIGAGVIILLLLYWKKKGTKIVVDTETTKQANTDTFGGGGGGGVVPTTLTRESIITPVAVAAAPTLVPVTTPVAPLMNLSAPTSPMAIGSTASNAAPQSTVTPDRAAPAPAPSTPPVIAKPATSPLINATARFDGLDDYAFDGAIGF